jgi:hypothetical protein
MKKSVTLPTLAVAMLSFSSAALAATCNYYDVTIESTVTGPYAQGGGSVRQQVVVRDQGAATHPFELLIRYVGDPNAFATQVGSIELMSNTMFANNAGIAAAAYDLGTFGQAANGGILFTIDPTMALQEPAPNVFAAPGAAGNPGGLGGECLLPALQALCAQYQGAPILSVFYMIPSQGGVVFGFPDQYSIQGEMHLSGAAYGSPNLQATYVGRFSGTYIGSSAC